MSEKIEPALSAEEWAEFLNPANKDWAPLMYRNQSDEAAAAIALYGRITWEMVDALREELDEEWSGVTAEVAFPRVGQLRALADLLESLLPPREST